MKGYEEAVVSFKEKVAEKRAALNQEVASDPYKVLGVDKDANEEQILSALATVLDRYSEDKFKDLDKFFVEFAEIKRRRVKEAYKRVKIGKDLEGACIG